MFCSATRYKFSFFFIFLSFVLQASPGLGETVNLLTLEDAIDIALEKSYEMKSLHLAVIAAEERLVAAKGRFKTNAEMNMDIPSWRESVTSIPVQDALPVFNTTGTVRFEGQLNIIQPLPTDGNLTLTSRMYHNDVSTYVAELANSLKRKDVLSSISLNFYQPLFTLNRLKIGLKQADLRYERTNRRFKRSELNIIYRVTDSFFALYQATRQYQIAQDNVNQQQELYDLASKKYEAGLIPEVEALQMEVDLAESRSAMVAAEATQSRSRDTFIQLIGLKFSDQVGVKTEFEFAKIEVDLDRAVELALENRAEIRESEIDVELSKISVKEADAASDIQGTLWAFYDITGVSDANLPYNSSPQELWRSSLDDMERRPNNRGVGFTLSVPIFDWGVNRAEVAAARAELRDTELALEEEKKTIIREVRTAVNRLAETENRLEVLQKREEVAQRAFDISLQRFNNGDITSQELALDRDRLISSKTAYLNAYVEYRLAVADLKQKTMWDFETDQSLVE